MFITQSLSSGDFSAFVHHKMNFGWESCARGGIRAGCGFPSAPGVSYGGATHTRPQNTVTPLCRDGFPVSQRGAQPQTPPQPGVQGVMLCWHVWVRVWGATGRGVGWGTCLWGVRGEWGGWRWKEGCRGGCWWRKRGEKGCWYDGSQGVGGIFWGEILERGVLGRFSMEGGILGGVI